MVVEDRRSGNDFCRPSLTSGIGTTEAEQMGKPIIDDELWTLIEPLLPLSGRIFFA